MARYTATIEVPVAITDAFDYLADFSTTQEWDPGVSDAEMLTPVPVGVGSQFRVVAGFAGRRVPLTYGITVFERPNRLTVRAENSSIISEDTITFSADTDVTATGTGDRVSIRYEADLKLKGLFKLFAPITALLFKGIGDRAAAGLRLALLDRGTRPAA